MERLAWLLLPLALLTARAGEAGEIAVGEEANGKTLPAEIGQVVVIRLRGNATTGYLWQVRKLEGEAMEQVGKAEYVPDKAPGRVGAGGVFTATFRAVKAGLATATLVYLRPWEKDKPPAKTFTLSVRVAPQ